MVIVPVPVPTRNPEWMVALFLVFTIIGALNPDEFDDPLAIKFKRVELLSKNRRLFLWRLESSIVCHSGFVQQCESKNIVRIT